MPAVTLAWPAITAAPDSEPASAAVTVELPAIAAGLELVTIAAVTLAWPEIPAAMSPDGMTRVASNRPTAPACELSNQARAFSCASNEPIVAAIAPP